MTIENTPVQQQAPAGWYPVSPTQQRFWDGYQWTEHVAPWAEAPVYAQPVAAASHIGPMTASQLNVKREVNYVRQQTPHSTTKHTLIALCTLGFSLPVTLYYVWSPNHYFHA